MLLATILNNFIKVGTLNIIDVSGKRYSFSGTPNYPAVTLRFHNKKIEKALLLQPDMALGEGYMNGDYTIEEGSLTDFLDICTRNAALNSFGWINKITDALMWPLRFFDQHNPLGLAKQHIGHHYDLNSDLFKLFLDPDLQYSCAYFTKPDNSLEIAQEDKKRHLAAKLRLQPGQKVLDIGSGWGGLALYLAKYADVDVTGLTLSEEQLKVSNDRAKQMGLSDRVHFYLRDYREEKNYYDRIVSVGMFEHVGVPYYEKYFTEIHDLLNESGIAVIHSIGSSKKMVGKRGFCNKYIFPGCYCPALSEVLPIVEHSKLFVTDIEILRYHYAYTLKHWYERFQENRHKAKEIYDERFCRMWEYYLKVCEMSFWNLGYMNFQIQLARNPMVAPLTRDYIFEKEHAL